MSGFRRELILQLTGKGFTVREARRTLNAIFESITAALQRKETVETPIGTLNVTATEKRRAWRFGRVVVFKQNRVEFKLDAEPQTMRRRKRAIPLIPDEDMWMRVKELQSSWHELDDISRGELIAEFHAAGVSHRNLGALFGKSEGLIRHLEIAGLMENHLKEMVRRGTESTRSAVMYARNTGRFSKP